MLLKSWSCGAALRLLVLRFLRSTSCHLYQGQLIPKEAGIFFRSDFRKLFLMLGFQIRL